MDQKQRDDILATVGKASTMVENGKDATQATAEVVAALRRAGEHRAADAVEGKRRG